MKYNYLFEAHDNGYGICCDRTYFTTDTELTQELVNECIKLDNPAPGRIGSNFIEFKNGAEQKGFVIKELPGQIKVDGVFQNIQGNY